MMGGNLLKNLEEYLTKMSKKYKDLNVEKYMELLKQNKDNLKELLLESEIKKYDLIIRENELNGYDTIVAFHYNSPNSIYVLKYMQYDNYYLKVEKVKDLGYWEWQENDKVKGDNEISFGVEYIKDNLRNEIEWRKKHIELEKERLKELKIKSKSLGA